MYSFFIGSDVSKAFLDIAYFNSRRGIYLNRYSNDISGYKKMIKEVERVLSMYEEDQDTAVENAVNFLKDWLINHINGTDKEYSSFLIGKGVK